MTHEFDGRKYEQVSAHQQEWGARLVSDLSLNGTERVLDLGCGDGTTTARIAWLLPDGEVIGIDSSTGMITAARPKEEDNLHFYLLDIDALAFREEFDVIVSNAALHWVKDHRCLLHNVARALRPGGRIRFNFAAHGNCSHLEEVVRRAMADLRFGLWFDDFSWPWFMPTLEEYGRLAQASPLNDIEVWGENADRSFPDRDALIGWLDQPSLVPFLAHLPQEKKSAFREHVIEEMVRQTRQPDGRFFETFRRLNLSARK